MALNNLATVLGEHSTTATEACELIDRAIAQAGPLAELLDTKGTLLLASGDAEGAVTGAARSDRSFVGRSTACLSLGFGSTPRG